MTRTVHYSTLLNHTHFVYFLLFNAVDHFNRETGFAWEKVVLSDRSVVCSVHLIVSDHFARDLKLWGEDSTGCHKVICLVSSTTFDDGTSKIATCNKVNRTPWWKQGFSWTNLSPAVISKRILSTSSSAASSISSPSSMLSNVSSSISSMMPAWKMNTCIMPLFSNVFL